MIADETAPKDEEADLTPRESEKSICLRCRLPKPVNEDGFCEPCAAEIEKACL